MSHQFEVHVEPFMMRQAWNAWFFAKGLAWKGPIALVIMMAPVLMKPQSDGSDTTSVMYLNWAHPAQYRTAEGKGCKSHPMHPLPGADFSWGCRIPRAQK